jgi:hypothetical protein
MNSQVYKPSCVKISKIRLINSDICYKHIPIQFCINNVWKTGFLTKDRIIVSFSVKINCNDVLRIINVPSIGKSIMNSHGISNIWDTKNVNFEKINFFNDISYKNYTHVEGLVNGIDLIGQIHNLSVITENGNEWMVIQDDNSKEENLGYVLASIKDWFLNISGSILKWGLIGITIVVLVYILYKLFIIWIKNCFTKRRKRSNLPVRFRKLDGNTSETIELENSSPLSVPAVSNSSSEVLNEENLELGKVSLINKSSLSINTMSAV